MEELRGVVVSCEVREASRATAVLEVRAVEVFDEVLRDGATAGTAGVDGEDQNPDRFVLALHWHLENVRAFALRPEISMLGKVGGMLPLLEIGQGEDPNHIFHRVGNRHDPLLEREATVCGALVKATIAEEDKSSWKMEVGIDDEAEITDLENNESSSEEDYDEENMAEESEDGEDVEYESDVGDSQ